MKHISSFPSPAWGSKTHSMKYLSSFPSWGLGKRKEYFPKPRMVKQNAFDEIPLLFPKLGLGKEEGVRFGGAG
jgi:hypothetical protein